MHSKTTATLVYLTLAAVPTGLMLMRYGDVGNVLTYAAGLFVTGHFHGRVIEMLSRSAR